MGKIDDNREKFLTFLKSVDRSGIDDLIKYLETKTDFFTAPASTKFHGNFEGGLCQHSIDVYENLKNKVGESDTVKIVGLLHDICKTNFYKVDYRNAKNEDGVWVKVPYYKVEDEAPYGHGEKSVMIISEFIKLSAEEKYAIRWHMGFSEPKENYNYLGIAFEKYPLALYTHEADLEATYITGV